MTFECKGVCDKYHKRQYYCTVCAVYLPHIGKNEDNRCKCCNSIVKAKAKVSRSKNIRWLRDVFQEVLTKYFTEKYTDEIKNERLIN